MVDININIALAFYRPATWREVIDCRRAKGNIPRMGRTFYTIILHMWPIDVTLSYRRYSEAKPDG